MSKSKARSGAISPQENLAPLKAKMRFSEPKFYNDLGKPMFEANKVYELEGADWIQRWMKRGGEIVEGDEPAEEKSVAPGPRALEDIQQLQDQADGTSETGPSSLEASHVDDPMLSQGADSEEGTESQAEESGEEVVDETEKKEKKHRFGHKR